MSATTTYSLLCFGIARDITGTGRLSLTLADDGTVGDLRRELEKRYPDFTTLVSYAIARNETYATDQEVLGPGDVLAVIPPVSGG